MAQDVVPIRVEVDHETDAELRKWAKKDQRSKRNLLSVIARKLTQIRKQNPAVIEQLLAM